MEGLPDDMLLAVMQLLDVRSLFACRLVSKRIGALALHPCVWRRQKLEVGCRYSCFNPDSPMYGGYSDSWDGDGDDDDDDDSESLYFHLSSSDDDAECKGSQECAVLCLAPCLRKMLVYLAKEKHLPPYATTRCAVKELELHVSKNTAMRAAVLIRNQEALGRLRRLDLHLLNSLSREEVSVLLGTVASTGALEKLVIRGQASDSSVLHRTASVSSLRFFDCDFIPNFQPFYNFVLRGHAATLSEVYLRSAFVPTSTKTAALLGTMPNLRVLHCPQLPGMDAVAKAESLRVLTLSIETGSLPLPELTKFFRRASQLQEVRLTLPASNVGLHLVQAPLATSRLQTLVVKSSTAYEVAQHLPQCREPISALPSLPALRRVELVGVSVDIDGLLLNIGRDTAPALRSLKLKLIKSTAPPGTTLRCPRAWLHSHAVKIALAVNPLLHIQINCKPHEASPNYVNACPYCKACKMLKCHQQKGISGRYWYGDEQDLGLFSHDPKHQCSCPEYHRASSASSWWVHIA